MPTISILQDNIKAVQDAYLHSSIFQGLWHLGTIKDEVFLCYYLAAHHLGLFGCSDISAVYEHSSYFSSEPQLRFKWA